MKIFKWIFNLCFNHYLKSCENLSHEKIWNHLKYRCTSNTHMMLHQHNADKLATHQFKAIHYMFLIKTSWRYNSDNKTKFKNETPKESTKHYCQQWMCHLAKSPSSRLKQSDWHNDWRPVKTVKIKDLQ